MVIAGAIAATVVVVMKEWGVVEAAIATDGMRYMSAGCT
jgi:hypothetical protein